MEISSIDNDQNNNAIIDIIIITTNFKNLNYPKGIFNSEQISFSKNNYNAIRVEINHSKFENCFTTKFATWDSLTKMKGIGLEA
jgi:hypothetical protein